MFESVEAGVLVYDADGALVATNPAARRILGLPDGDLMLAQFSREEWAVVHPDGARWSPAEWPTVITCLTGRPVSGAVMGLQADGDVVLWLRVSTCPFATSAGSRGVVATFVDVTEVTRLTHVLARSEARFSTAFDEAPIGMALVDVAGRLIRTNQAMAIQLGRSREELIGRDWTEIMLPDETDRAAEVGAELEAGDTTHLSAFRLLGPDGSVVHAELSITLVRDDDGSSAYYFVQSVDISDRVRLTEELDHRARHDYLTGLLNRRGFEEAATQHQARVQRYGDGGALLVIDLDDFKEVNDRGGHPAGDRLLVAVAELLKGRLRASDVIGRTGGDEFAVLLPRASVDDSLATAHDLLSELKRLPEPCGASIGVALFTPDRDLDTVMVAADQAMYRQKVTGKGGVLLEAT